MLEDAKIYFETQFEKFSTQSLDRLTAGVVDEGLKKLHEALVSASQHRKKEMIKRLDSRHGKFLFLLNLLSMKKSNKRFFNNFMNIWINFNSLIYFNQLKK